ncbi:hypothetical protein ACSNOI_06530 [Actinomadura kijaniata]|uniref:hypothetical protein n=1 Tax=Actinomadura kijaniata TaxID=46161 RepID=UPI003F1C5A62
MRARFQGAWAVAVAAVLAAGLTGCSSDDGGKPGGTTGSGPRVVEESTVRADKRVELKEAETVRIDGLADRNAAQQVNQALRAPLEWAVNWTFSTLDEERKKQCAGRNNVIQTKVLLGLRGEIVAASNAISLIPCYEGEGALPTVPVIVDVKNAKALTAADVLTGKTLEKDGLKKLWDALSGPKQDWKDCDLEDLRRQDFFPGKRDGDPVESPAPAGIMFRAEGMQLIWSTTGTDCNNFTFTAPYDKVKDMINPELYPRLLASAGGK